MHHFLLLIALALFLGLGNLRAQDSTNENPTGPTGDYNGEVTTAGSYDPYTQNAKRSVTDLVVPGSNGTYPLAFSRTYNSGISPVANDIKYFGDGGNWRHSYMWTLTPLEFNTYTGQLTAFNVAYPSGGVVTFRSSRAEDTTGTYANYWRGPTGTQDRLEVPPGSLNPAGVILHTSDGGLVKFGSNYHPLYIVDPYGATTSLTYNNDGHLATVVEPGGRWLHFSYITVSFTSRDQNNHKITSKWTLLQQVSASTGQTVNYHYQPFGEETQGNPDGEGSIWTTPYYVLDIVIYNSESSVADPGISVRARYTYDQIDDSIPVIVTAVDPHYAGAMTSIQYTYSDMAYGLVQEEQNINTSETVSHLDRDDDTNTSKETRGDVDNNHNPITRTFRFNEGTHSTGNQPTDTTNAKDAQLTSYTDFEGHTTYLSYYGAGDPTTQEGSLWAVTDAANHTTLYAHEPCAGKLYALQLPDNRVRYWTWQSKNHTDARQPYYLYKSQDERGQVTTYIRDFNTGLVTEIDYPDNTSESFTYTPFTGADGQSTYYKIGAHTSKLGAVTQYTYGQNPNSTHADMLLSVTRSYNEADGGPHHDELTKFEYDALDRLVKTTDPSAVATQFTYNARHQLVTTTHAWDGTHIDRSYDDLGNCTSVSDELQHVTTTTYDEYRRPITVTVPVNNDGITSRTSYFAYDPRGFSNYGGNIASATSHTRSAVGVSWTSSGKATAHAYSPSGLYTETFWNGQKTGNDGNGNPTFYLNWGWGVTRTHFDPSSQVGWSSDQVGDTTHYSLDSCGRKSTVTDPLGHVSTWTYYGANEAAIASGGNPNCAGLLKSVTTPGPDVATPTVTTKYANYDVMGRMIQSINPKNYWFFSGYDAAGDLTGQTDGAQSANNAQPQAHRIGYGYDTLGRKAYVTNPLTGAKEQWTYDKSGNVSTYTNYAGAVCTYQYDGRNRCSRYDWTGDGGVTAPTSYAYDNASRVTEVLNWHADIHYAYDDSGAVITEQQKIYPSGPALTTTYHHDADGNVQSIQYPGGKTPTFAYDLQERCNAITLNGTQIGAYDYDDRELVFRRCGNLAQTTYTYYGGRVIETDEHRYEGSGLNLTSDRFYGHAPDGQISWWYRTAPGSGYGASSMENGRGDAFFYDSDGSLINAARDITTVNGNWPSQYGDSSLSNNISYANPSSITSDYGYAYDAAGNRTTVQPYTYPATQPLTTYAAKDDNEYQSYTRGRTTRNFFYDNNFNLKLVGATGWTYTYDAENHLTNADYGSSGYGTPGQQTVFNYDGLGRLVEQVINGTVTHFYYAGSQRIEERDGNDALVYSYFFDGPSGDSILCRQNALGVNLWYQADIVGNTSHVTNDGGQIVEQYLYDAYGTPTVYDRTGSLLNGGTACDNHYLFKSSGAYEWLPTLGLYYCRARFYLPQHGRWLQPDPVGQAGGLNIYTYCGNDPVNGIDPSGLSSDERGDLGTASSQDQPYDMPGDMAWAFGSTGGLSIDSLGGYDRKVSVYDHTIDGQDINYTPTSSAHVDVYNIVHVNAFMGGVYDTLNAFGYLLGAVGFRPSNSSYDWHTNYRSGPMTDTDKVMGQFASGQPLGDAVASARKISNFVGQQAGFAMGGELLGALRAAEGVFVPTRALWIGARGRIAAIASNLNTIFVDSSSEGAIIEWSQAVASAAARAGGRVPVYIEFGSMGGRFFWEYELPILRANNSVIDFIFVP